MEREEDEEIAEKVEGVASALHTEPILVKQEKPESPIEYRLSDDEEIDGEHGVCIVDLETEEYRGFESKYSSD